MRRSNLFLVLPLATFHAATSLSSSKPKSAVKTPPEMNRRDLFGIGLVSTALLFGGDSAEAFPNKISTKYDDRPKRRGPQPKDLGVGPRKDMIGDEYVGLKNCGPAPNCFCSTDDPEDEPDHYIPAWIWPESLDQEKAFQQLEQVIQAYQPGQDNVDGGGFQIVTSKNGYIYTQFEALKNGYIDDLELAVVNGKGPRAVQVRSSSRVGYLDYGVNGKRVNYIAKSLREKGWNAPGVDYDTHRNYAIQNEVI
ncbi:Protein of unknown function (DUF1499) [Seminavis robusta]|uniref:Uncharacterized protein n=1 Tax=Seminavis robusta TaxID=568900 RepID=A0A9N8H803_9STRA|nr:Protein of unknown function (DUF1499) [Seminavis robusta]|eukprot:Sro155_g070510.1 Protein of unknown function (DUF1499) (251) ;mRNA; r:89920-90755